MLWTASSFDLDTVELDLRNQYLLLYRPKTLIHNGAFHKIVLVGPERVANIVGTSGFYAPTH
jgi:Ca-activated chloride channel homolog